MSIGHERNESPTRHPHGGSFREWAERTGTALGVLVTIAYISGFLISNTYLGTYHMALGSGEFLRAKYIYIGFLFLAFTVLIAALFRLLVLWSQQFFDRKRISAARIVRDRGVMVAVSHLLDRRSADVYQRTRVRYDELRGQSVVALIATVLIIQVLFLNPNSQKSILFVNLLFFVSTAVYQLTFYGELFAPYAKGLIYGRRFISDVRMSLFLYAQIPAAVAIIFRKSLPENLHSGAWQAFAWGIGLLLIAVATTTCVIGIAAVKAFSERLKAIDNLPCFDPAIWLDQMKERAEGGKIGTRHFYLRWALVGYLFDASSRTGWGRQTKRALKLICLGLAIFLAEYLCWFGGRNPFQSTFARCILCTCAA